MQVGFPMGFTARVNQSDTSHIAIRHLITAKVYRMVSGQFRIHTLVCLSESDSLETAVIGWELLLHDIGFMVTPIWLACPVKSAAA